MYRFLVGLLLLASVSARAFELPAAPIKMAAKTDWDRLVGKIAAQGRYRPSEGRIPAYIGLEDVRGPKDAEHLADYATLFGWADEQGRFYAEYATLVSEDWAFDAAGRWSIKQWIIRVDMEGNIFRADEYLLVKTRDHIVLEHRQSSPTAQARDAKFRALLAFWLSR